MTVIFSFSVVDDNLHVSPTVSTRFVSCFVVCASRCVSRRLFIHLGLTSTMFSGRHVFQSVLDIRVLCCPPQMTLSDIFQLLSSGKWSYVLIRHLPKMFLIHRWCVVSSFFVSVFLVNSPNFHIKLTSFMCCVARRPMTLATALYRLRNHGVLELGWYRMIGLLTSSWPIHIAKLYRTWDRTTFSNSWRYYKGCPKFTASEVTTYGRIEICILLLLLLLHITLRHEFNIVCWNFGSNNLLRSCF